MTRLAPSISLETFNGVVDKLYDAAADPSRWPATLQNMMAAFESRSAVFALCDPSAKIMPRFDIIGSFAEVADPYVRDYLPGDPRTRYGLTSRSSQVMYDYLWIDEANLCRSESYDWLTRNIGDKYTVGMGAWLQNRQFAGVLFGRSARQGHAQRAEVETFRLVLPHYVRALDLMASLEHLATLATIDAAQVGVVLVNAHGKVVFANRAARAKAEVNDGIALSSAGLTCRKSSDRLTLQKLVADAMPKSASLTRGGRMVISRPSGRAPYIVSVAPWRGMREGLFAPAAVVTITDPAPDVADAPVILKQTFGLSKAEAQVASILAEGMTLDEASEKLGVSINTVRTQLRGIFAKTETRRQSQLVRLLSTALIGQAH